MGLLDQFGMGETPVAQFVGDHRNLLASLGAGIASGRNFGEGLGMAAQLIPRGMAADQVAVAEREDRAQERQRINQTLQLMQRDYPDLAQLFEGGTPEIQSGAVSEMFRRMGQANGGGVDPTYSMTPVFMTDAEGNPRIGQMSSGGGMYVDGQVMNSLPQGWRITNRPQAMSTIDLGTSRGVFNPNSGQVEGNIPIDNMGAEFDKQIGGNMADNFTDLQVAAQDAQSSLQATLEAKSLLDSGVITGFGADWMLNAGKALQAAGFNVNEDAIANTEAFAATRAQEVGRIIKLFGAGTGLSDADREFATRAAAGQITMNEASIRRILDINERASRNIIARYNEQAQGVQNGQMPSLTMNAPDATGSGNIVDYLDFFNQ